MTDSTEPIRVLVVDDHSVVRSGLRALLETVDGIEVVGEAGGGHEAVRLAVDTVPDVVLMDLQMPDGDGIDATRAIAAECPSAAVLVLTMYERDDMVFSALRAGARGYLLKGAAQAEVIRSIVAVAAGQVILGSGAADRVLTSFASPPDVRQPFPQLTHRERDVLRLIAEGHSNDSIARSINVATKTVANHVSNILSKLQFADRAAAIVAARRAGLVVDVPDSE
jgi:DNA-binding NarL/FixJ family response regulator